MSTSKLPKKPQTEASVIQFLADLFAKDKDALTTASAVSASLDIPAADVRVVLSDLALQKALKPIIKMVCQDCGTTNEEIEKGETEAPCHVCGDTTSHLPIVKFALGDGDFFKRRTADPKRPGRPLPPRARRPRPWLGAWLKRQEMIA
jgi:hypothetical protein